MSESEERTLLDVIKESLRRTDDDIDESLQADIDAALEDMGRVGVVITEGEETPLIIKCVDLFVKGQIDYLNQGERFMLHYRRLRDSLSLSESYKEAAENG